MAVSSAEVGYVDGRILSRYTETGSMNTELITTIAARSARRVAVVIVAYTSLVLLHDPVTVKLDSGAGAAYDTTLHTGAADVRYTVYRPTDLFISSDDTAPAGGLTITASVVAYTVEA